MTQFSSSRADALHQAGMKCSDAGDADGAIAKYTQALALDPQRASTLYNLGLIYKYRGEWRTSFAYNQQARELEPGDEATLWNLAIAATALQDWAAARDVWRDLKIFSQPGDGPIEANFGTTPVRLNADAVAAAAMAGATAAAAEVVWANRICPVRARILGRHRGAGASLQ